jgi:hypothetical protein
MSQLALLGGSLAAILLLAMTAYLLRLGSARLNDVSEACEVAERTFADFDADRAWLDSEGAGAIVRGRDGSHVLVRRHGAHFIARRLESSAAIAVDGRKIVIASGERLLAPLTITLESDAEAGLLTSLLGSRAPHG